MGDFIRILEEDTTFEWAPINPSTGRKYADVTLTRRKMGHVERRALIKKHTTMKKGRSVFDAEAFGDEAMDQVIRSWSGVMTVTITEDGDQVDTETPCTFETKQKLPDTLRNQIAAMCLGMTLEQVAGEDDPDGPLP